MQWSLFLLILMGQCVFFICQLYEYKFVNEKKNWTEAQKHCREEFTDLATVYDMADMKRLHRYLKRNEKDDSWIGLYNEPNGTESLKWHWSLPGVEYNENQSTWGANERTGNTESCARITNQEWQDIACSRKHYFICYDANSSLSKFHLIEKEMEWLKAQKYCRKHHTDLVSGLEQLQDTELISMIAEHPKNSSKNQEWTIGLFRDTWRWSDGSSFSFRNWNLTNTHQPKGRKCAMCTRQSKRMNSVSCDVGNPFFCYKDKVILIQQNKTWDEALEYCRRHHKDLVSITNLKDQRWIQDKAKNASSPFVWLGLRYTCTLGFWFWVSDETVRYEYWASDVGNDDCDMSGAMERGGEYKWSKKNDADKFNFICSKN